MRVALIHPAGSNWPPGKKDITAAANRMPPLGLLSIAVRRFYLSKERRKKSIRRLWQHR